MIEQDLLAWRNSHRRKPLIVQGARQVGKTYSIEKLGIDYFDVLAKLDLEKNRDWHQIFEGDLEPQRILSQLEVLLNTRIVPGKTLLFLDEITSAPPSVSAAAYQLILDRRLGDYQVPDGWAIFAAGNRQGDRGVTYSMPAPLANRFSHYEVDTHLDDWVAWAFKNDIDERIIAFVRFRPELLFDFDPAHNPVAFPSPRSWEYSHRALKKFMDTSDLLLGSLQACVGQAAGIELKAFIDNLDNMPDLEAIVRGEKTSVPKEIDLQYAVATALVGHAIRAKNTDDAQEKFGHILNYAQKMPQREMGVMLVSDMHRAIGQDLFSVPQFSQWANSIADVMIY